MPNPAMMKLDKNSSDAQARAALSECIAMEMDNGNSQEQAQGMCYGMLREKMGRDMMPQGGK